MTQPLLPSTNGTKPCHVASLVTKTVVRKNQKMTFRQGVPGSDKGVGAQQGGEGTGSTPSDEEDLEMLPFSADVALLTQCTSGNMHLPRQNDKAPKNTDLVPFCSPFRTAL